MSFPKGKQERDWLKTRKKWMKLNPPTHEGYWFCVVGYAALDKYALTVDHDVSRSRDPSKRHELDNLNPMCYYHNNDKGSKTLKEYMDSNPRRRCI